MNLGGAKLGHNIHRRGAIMNRDRDVGRAGVTALRAPGGEPSGEEVLGEIGGGEEGDDKEEGRESEFHGRGVTAMLLGVLVVSGTAAEGLLGVAPEVVGGGLLLEWPSFTIVGCYSCSSA